MSVLQYKEPKVTDASVVAIDLSLSMIHAGYALSELRLYKELKVAMETHIAELQASVASLECRYEQCVQRLQQAEALGFTA